MLWKTANTIGILTTPNVACGYSWINNLEPTCWLLSPTLQTCRYTRSISEICSWTSCSSFADTVLVSLAVCCHRFSSWQRQSFNLQVLGWVFNFSGCQLLPYFVVMVGVCFWLRILGFMLVTRILDQHGTIIGRCSFPMSKSCAGSKANKSWLCCVGGHHFLLWNSFPVWFECFPSALLIPLLSRAPAEAASLTPSPRALPSTGEQQGVNMHSTCEGTWVLSLWLAGLLWGSGWTVGAVHTAVSRVRACWASRACLHTSWRGRDTQDVQFHTAAFRFC